MIDKFIISGATKVPCQKCGQVDIPLTIGKHECKCGQNWRVSVSRGSPFAQLPLAYHGMSVQSGNPTYYSGCLVEGL